MSTYGKNIRNLLGSLKPPRFDIVDQIWTVLFEKKPWKIKHPLKAPKKSRDFWEFLGFSEPNRVELFSRGYLNYSNITRKRSLILKTRCVLKIFSLAKPRRVKNSPATGVTVQTRVYLSPLRECKGLFLTAVQSIHAALPGVSRTWPLYVWFTCMRCQILSFFFLSWVSKTQPNHWTKRMANNQLSWLLCLFLSLPPSARHLQLSTCHHFTTTVQKKP